MSRNRRRYSRRDDQSQAELDLKPIMNMVIILIPMMLLSVVFLKVGVINITSPSMTPGKASSDDTKEDWQLTVAISERGFQLSTNEKTYAAREGCPSDGPTLCLTGDTDEVGAKIDEARVALERGEAERAKRLLSEVAGHYDFAGLYNRLQELKAEHPNETRVHLTAGPDIPYKLLIRVMDAARYELDEKQYASNQDFWSANRAERSGAGGQLFSDPILAVGH